MKHLTKSAAGAAFGALMLLAAPAAAEMELNFYVGVQNVDSSTGTGTLPGGAPINRKFKWKANPLESPFYYGARATWWTQNNLGFGIEGTHTKVYASNADMAALGVSKLELSDGHNILTFNVMKRWPGTFENTKFTPYAGAGLGVAIPHVDVQVVGASNRTHDFETTGLAARLIAGMKYDINEKWGIFGEYQMTWSDNDITINPDPLVVGQTAGKLKTDIMTHAVNIGISYSF